MSSLPPYAVVALLAPATGRSLDAQSVALQRGCVGTIVDLPTPTQALVDFAYSNGKTYALATVPVVHLLQLHRSPTHGR